jgi:hypothetical protein
LLLFPGWLDGAPAVSDFSTVPGDGVDGYAREIVVAPTTAFTRAPEGYSFAEALQAAAFVVSRLS